MKKNVIIGVIVVAVVIVGAIVLISSNKETGTNTPPSILNPRTRTIDIVDTGFTPRIFTIKKGDTVTWINKRSAASWPASAQHPSHTIYPGSNINKCGTLEESAIFDACHELQQGDTYRFTFNEVGSWNYHDHLIPGFDGRIVVEP